MSPDPNHERLLEYARLKRALLRPLKIYFVFGCVSLLLYYLAWCDGALGSGVTCRWGNVFGIPATFFELSMMALPLLLLYVAVIWAILAVKRRKL